MIINFGYNKQAHQYCQLNTRPLTIRNQRGIHQMNKNHLLSGCRSSHQSCSVEKGLLKSFANFTEKHLCWSFFLIKLQTLRLVTILKRDSNTDVFLWCLRNFCYEQMCSSEKKPMFVNEDTDNKEPSNIIMQIYSPKPE